MEISSPIIPENPKCSIDETYSSISQLDSVLASFALSAQDYHGMSIKELNELEVT
jgi:hypothetical protein